MEFLFYVLVLLNVFVEIKSDSKITARETESDGVQITCDIEGKKNVYWEWKPIKRSHQEKFIELPHYEKKTDLFDGESSRQLTIKTISKNVYGNYRCRYYTDPKIKPRKNSSELIVGKPGKPEVKEKKYFVEKHMSGTIRCLPNQTFPEVKIWWSKWVNKTHKNCKEHRLSDTSKYSGINTSSLTIYNFDTKDEGYYVCCVKNAYGNARSDKVKVKEGEPPCVTSEQTTVGAEIGKSIMLHVTVREGKPSRFNVTWYSHDKPISQRGTELYGGYNISYPSLSITNVRQNGTYRCTAANIVNKTSVEIKLIAWSKPKVKIEEGNLEKMAGVIVSIYCRYTSVPNVSITWERTIFSESSWTELKGSDRINISTERSVSRLSISSIRLNDTGNYTCRASHQFANGTDSIKLTVGNPPSVSVKDEYVATVGGNVIIKCNVSKDATNVTLFFTNKKFNQRQGGEEPNADFPIKNVTTDHAGILTCQGTNKFGSKNDTAELIVLSAKLQGNTTDVKKNMSIMLSCVTEGKGEIIWRKDTLKLNLTSNQQNLTLSRVNRTHSGNYTCERKYNAKTARSDIVEVYVKDTPMVESNSLAIESFSGKKLIIHCKYDSKSDPTKVYWMHNNTNISLSQKLASNSHRYSGGNVSIPSLTIHVPKPADSGDYVCIVTNEIGQGNSSVIKVVVKAPDKTESGRSGVGAVIGGIVAIILLIAAIVILRKKIRKGKEETNSTCDTENKENAEVKYSRVEKRRNEKSGDKLYVSVDGFAGEQSNPNINRVAVELDPADMGEASTYYNVFEANPTCVKVTDLMNYLKEKEVGDGLQKEFKDVPYGIVHSTNESQTSENKPKNRYKTTFAYDHTRVILRNSSSKSDYINANYIDSCEREKQYIACQGPIKPTLIDHWRMIWQDNIRQIVMLTNLVEGMKVKCERYWPDCTGEMKIGPFRLNLVTEKERATYVTREIDVRNKEGHGMSQSRRIVQYHFTSWPDHGTPDPLDLIAFYRHVVADELERDVPLLVHCSAGIGRTGTYIGLDAMTKEGSKSGYIDVFRYLKQMRYCRMNMIQTLDQYKFLHQALLEMFSVKDASITKEEFGRVWDRFQADKGPINSHNLFKEFKNLQSLVEDSVGMPCVLQPADPIKNRNQRVLPLESSRVYLVSYETGRSDYINAVNVPSYIRRRGYIVTQLPLPETIVDFWTMMVDHGSSTIVLILEDQSEESLVYTNGYNRMETGSFIIDVIDREECGSDIVKVRLAVSRKGGEKYKILVYQVVCKGVIQTKQLCGLTDLVSNQLNKSDLPITVVSSDGARNCGLFCVFANAVSSMTMDDRVNVVHLARVVKLQQPELLSTYDEYTRCYEALNEYMESSSNIYANT